MTEHKVHVGFGFHVNCYHSYRGDTNDALGFGKDIRLIRYIIDTFDQWNKQGVPAKATWDFENAYSLEDILPKYAPDIIDNVRRRQAENGDENILMGYNNGAMSAMTDDEFLASVRWAVSNAHGSGLKDLFGSCEMIIRPQEVMFTPSNTTLYRKAGVKAVCLYYSCVSFDAFRTLIPPLPDVHAFNPLTYRYGEDTVTVLPMISNSDLIDAGSLRALVCDLHAQQLRGSIDNDVFVFINMDADSFLWEPMKVPKFLKAFPNVGGIDGLIREIADLPFAAFSTPGVYLQTHGPLREIAFGQDVADGNLSGYASWSEKPFNRRIWTRLERARMLARLGPSDAASPSFETRVRLLSTTHFGLASPVLNVTREQTALMLSQAAVDLEREAVPKTDRLCLRNVTNSPLQCAQLTLKSGFCCDIASLSVQADGLVSFCAAETGRHADGSIDGIYLLCQFKETQAEYPLTVSLGGSQMKFVGGFSVSYNPKYTEFTLLHNGRNGRLRLGRIQYGKRIVPFGPPTITPLPLAGQGTGLRFAGDIHLPNETKAGRYVYDFFTSRAMDGVVLRTDIRYPKTPERDSISSHASNLGRFTDNQWKQAVTLEFLLPSDGVRIHKRNFAGDVSAYPVADFKNAFPQNRTMTSFNHQLTGGFLAALGPDGGLAIAHARQVLGSLAHCPMRLEEERGTVLLKINPFGAYYGKQRYYPSRSWHCMPTLYEMTAPQARSLAPAYNGVREMSMQAVFLLPGASLPETVRSQMCAFADGAVATDNGGEVRPFSGENVTFPTVKSDQKEAGQIKSASSSGVRISLLALLNMGVRFAFTFVSSSMKTRRFLKSLR